MKTITTVMLGMFLTALITLQGCGGPEGAKGPSERSHMQHQREREAYDELDNAVGN